MKKFLFAIMWLALMLPSCIEEMPQSPEDMNESEVRKVTCVADSFVFMDNVQTRSSADMSDITNIGFQWEEADTVGIFPAKGDQISFPMVKGATAGTATVDGGGWDLRNSSTYYAYYPFSRKNFDSNKRVTKIPYTYNGQTAVFEDQNGLVNIGAFDYMYALPCTPENGSANFQFKHLGALARMVVTFPHSTIYKTLRITAGEDIFPVEGTFDLTAESVSLIPTEYSSAIDIDLGELSGTEGERAIVYFMLPPVDMTGRTVSLTLTDADGNISEQYIESKNVVAGKAYGWSLFAMDAISLSENGTANCYIVSEEGVYKFPTVIGNSDNSVGAVASAEVLWETYGTTVTPSAGDLISYAYYAAGHITFQTSDKKGNALIAAKDKNGNILWSWHIWLTDQPEDQTYRNNAGVLMDRNLGATSATPGNVGALGLMYQWGRKDPFLGGSSKSSSTRAASRNALAWGTVSSTAATGTIPYAVTHPTTFITCDESNNDWYYTGTSTTDNSRWQSEKTIYDPCPSGYRVPDGDANGVWATAFGLSDNFHQRTYDSTNEGFNFGSSSTPYKLSTTSSICWYPSVGYIGTGTLENVGTAGGYWSCSSYENNHYFAYRMDLSDLGSGYGAVIPSFNSARALGLAVRCLKEDTFVKPEPKPEPTEVVDLSKPGTANSYVVSSSGLYKIRTVQGNSSIPVVGKVASAAVLWETYGTSVAPNVGDLIEDVNYADGYISFKASDKKGNALIAAKDASGKILWSWHIWLTDKPKDVVLYNNAGTLMDRNLGATSATPGDVGALGLYYQWGRKDPFMGKSTISVNSKDIKLAVATNGFNIVSSTQSTGTIEYATANPTTFLAANDWDSNKSRDWLCYPTSVINKHTDATRWQSTKTIYDPCPAGYRVTDGGGTSIWGKAFVMPDDISSSSFGYDKTNYGFDYGSGNSYKSITSEESIWFPLTSALLWDGSLSYYGYGMVWTVTHSYEYMAWTFYYSHNDRDSISADGNFEKASGFAVRCQKM